MCADAGERAREDSSVGCAKNPCRPDDWRPHAHCSVSGVTRIAEFCAKRRPVAERLNADRPASAARSTRKAPSWQARPGRRRAGLVARMRGKLAGATGVSPFAETVPVRACESRLTRTGSRAALAPRGRGRRNIRVTRAPGPSGRSCGRKLTTNASADGHFLLRAARREGESKNEKQRRDDAGVAWKNLLPQRPIFRLVALAKPQRDRIFTCPPA